MTEPTGNHTATLAVDSHVHLYHLDDLIPTLDGAKDYQRKISGTYNAGNPTTMVLVLAEPRDRHTFAKLQDRLKISDPTPLSEQWQLRSTAESLSLCAKHIDGVEVFLIRGQQIVTAERLEVLSIAAEHEVDDQRSLTETLTAIGNTGGFPVLPWGVGKWLFTRGKLVCELIRGSGPSTRAPFALGDNGGRPQFWRRVEQFDLARTFNIPIISGSDPLPAGSRRYAAASYGTLLRCAFDKHKPAASLLTAISERSSYTEPFGTLARPMDFMRDQLTLRFNSQ